jgi:hypothetical protein
MPWRAYPGAYLTNRLPAVLFYAVVCDPLEEAIELFTERREAELMVKNWNRDEPERGGELYIRPVELETSPN